MTETQQKNRSEKQPDAVSARKSSVLKWSLFAAMVLLFGYGAIVYQHELTLENIVRYESDFREFQRESPAGLYLAAFLLYVIVTGSSFPGATVLTLFYGWFFGFWPTVLLVSFASVIGASIAFLLSRYFFREAVQSRFGHRLQKFHTALGKDGAFYLFSLRLTPVVPFFIVNMVMGVTPLRLKTFCWVSQIGMLPGTCIYTYAGASFPTAQELVDSGVAGIFTPQLVLALIAFGFFPLIAKLAVRKLTTDS